jgi:hypothetical protein
MLTTNTESTALLLDLVQRQNAILERVAAALERLASGQPQFAPPVPEPPQESARPPESYSTDEFADLVGLATYTVRQWCGTEKIRADKLPKELTGRNGGWRIPHAEFIRFKAEGLIRPKRQKAA